MKRFNCIALIAATALLSSCASYRILSEDQSPIPENKLLFINGNQSELSANICELYSENITIDHDAYIILEILCKDGGTVFANHANFSIWELREEMNRFELQQKISEQTLDITNETDRIEAKRRVGYFTQYQGYLTKSGEFELLLCMVSYNNQIRSLIVKNNPGTGTCQLTADIETQTEVKANTRVLSRKML